MVVSSTSANLERQKKEARLVVYGYNSSGVAESLSLNEPCKVFLQYGFEALPERDKVTFKCLSDCAIAFESIEELAQSINASWDALSDQWWSPDTQSKLRIIRYAYARYSNSPVKDMRKILESIVTEGH
jgi:putative transferase (TIGR04331 family)